MWSIFSYTYYDYLRFETSLGLCHTDLKNYNVVNYIINMVVNYYGNSM